MMSASQDEAHTSHSCGDQPTTFGTTLHRARKIISPSEGKDVQIPVMNAERRATHTETHCWLSLIAGLSLSL